MYKLRLAAAACLFALAFSACSNTTTNTDNQLTEKEQSEGWKLLFDGTTTNGWHLYNQESIGDIWLIKDGVLYCNPNPDLDHGDLVTDESYINYDFKFDWKLGEGGNSGVFVNVLERKDLATAWASGPEYQLLDDKHKDAHIPTKISGCLYGFSPQLNPVKLTPNGGWNHSEIIQKDGKVSFYLNGTLTAEQDLKSTQWAEKVKNSNFKAFPEFGKYTNGRIALQDWTKGVSFKNLKIREL
ncbi:3-keto-disaccharide hydrolase [Mucilaginibacter pedocola]|uniref:Secreted glycosyl hydrolase n=1 Tax=Mucilaginibacter pedocola TaxID=1792845 RepID=A0A1S9PBZ9_9SPHI|nr:DUF1080 domain-containing protein [Mucilaginibacter pedocola]OOQ58503.1 secreted glycosyl hydrolase [Mucilaginibacter pedocola]